jgi:hypothetical protein
MRLRNLAAAIGSEVMQYADMKSAVALNYTNRHWHSIFSRASWVPTANEVSKISQARISGTIAALHKIDTERANELLPTLILEHGLSLGATLEGDSTFEKWHVTETQIVVTYESLSVEQLKHIVDTYNTKYKEIVAFDVPKRSEFSIAPDTDGPMNEPCWGEDDAKDDASEAKVQSSLVFDKIKFCQKVLPQLGKRFVSESMKRTSSHYFTEQVSMQLGLAPIKIQQTEELESSILQHAFALDIEQKLTISRDIDVTRRAVYDLNGSYAEHHFKALALNDENMKKNFFAVFFKDLTPKQHRELSELFNSRYGKVTRPWNELRTFIGDAGSSYSPTEKAHCGGGMMIDIKYKPGVYFYRSEFLNHILANLKRKTAARLEAKETKGMEIATAGHHAPDIGTTVAHRTTSSSSTSASVGQRLFSHSDSNGSGQNNRVEERPGVPSASSNSNSNSSSESVDMDVEDNQSVLRARV